MNIQKISENNNETAFEQKGAIINYGTGSISTYNLVNCIAIGGVFEFGGTRGTFLTHESPTDYQEQQLKLTKIKNILDEKKTKIIQIILFRIDKPSKSVYNVVFTTENIINLMIKYSESLFNLIPNIHTYSCEISTMKVGKVILSPTQCISVLTPFLLPLPLTHQKNPLQTYIVFVLYNKDGKKIYKCPLCNNITGTLAPENPSDTSLFTHNFNCSNKNKIPKEINVN